MGQLGWWFFYYFFVVVKMRLPRIMALLVSVHFLFIEEILIEGFVLKENGNGYSFVEVALTMRFCGT